MLVCCWPGLAADKLAWSRRAVATARLVDVGGTYAGILTEVQVNLS